jgi:hypothetical protein
MDEAIERVIGDMYRFTEAGDRLIERMQVQSRWNLEDIDRLRTGFTIMPATPLLAAAT